MLHVIIWSNYESNYKSELVTCQNNYNWSLYAEKIWINLFYYLDYFSFKIIVMWIYNNGVLTKIP